MYSRTNNNMANLCLITVLVILLIFLLNPNTVSPFQMNPDKNDTVIIDKKDLEAVGSPNYNKKPWDRASGSTYYMKRSAVPKETPLLHEQGYDEVDMLSDEPKKQYTTGSHNEKEHGFTRNILAGYDGHIPILDGDELWAGNEVGEAMNKPSEQVEGFWYDMNNIEKGKVKDKELNKEFESIQKEEKEFRQGLIGANVRRRAEEENPDPSDRTLQTKVPVKYVRGMYMIGHNPIKPVMKGSNQRVLDRLAEWDTTNIPVKSRKELGDTRPELVVKREGFGQNRATTYWNEVDYPIVTTQGIDLTEDFPQDGNPSGVHKDISVKSMWGKTDSLRPAPRYLELAGHGKQHSFVDNTISRIAPTHSIKVM
jgi:hypothetical protein